MADSHVTPEYPRAYEAAQKVDPMVLANALEHIARSAHNSRSQTRRIRWIARRAEMALDGKEYRDTDLDLPKRTGPDTLEKLQKRMAYHIAIKHNLAEKLRAIVTADDANELDDELINAGRAALAAYDDDRSEVSGAREVNHG